MESNSRQLELKIKNYADQSKHIFSYKDQEDSVDSSDLFYLHFELLVPQIYVHVQMYADDLVMSKP